MTIQEIKDQILFAANNERHKARHIKWTLDKLMENRGTLLKLNFSF